MQTILHGDEIETVFANVLRGDRVEPHPIAEAMLLCMVAR